MPRAPTSDGDVELLRADPLPDVGTASAAAHPDALLHHAVGQAARDSVAWSLFFIFLLYFNGAGLCGFAKLEVYQHVIGQPIASLPAWFSSWGSIGLVGACDGANAAQTFALCKASPATATASCSSRNSACIPTPWCWRRPRSPACPT